MKSSPRLVQEFLDAAPKAAVVEVTEAKGSTPRETGTWMLVSPETIFGTIGGGQLEFLAIARARELIAENLENGTLDIPLGPEIGQCCGGRVGLDISIADDARREELMKRGEAEDAALPHVYLFGGGHVGHALAAALALLPVNAIVVETRADALDGISRDVETRLTAVPEEEVRAAAAGSAYVVLTHDHALDFLIVAEVLARGDAAYVGMIGSKTKKATFRSWYRDNGGDPALADGVVTPIGGAAVRDKRPTVIAAMAAAEIMAALSVGG